MNQGRLFILSAPSGTGKTTILKKVMANIEGLAFSVSHTTRKSRRGEANGADYHFVERQEFVSMKDKGLFLECADVHGNFYGTSKLAVEEQLKNDCDVILDIDVQGARIIKDLRVMEATYIFLAPPSLAELERRLRERGSDDEASISLRLDNARKEMEVLDQYEYLIVNDSVDDAVNMFESIILAERCRNGRLISGKTIEKSTLYL